MSKRFYERIENLLDSLKEEGTYKEYQYLISPMSGKSTIEKYDDVIMLCSNNYLGYLNPCFPKSNRKKPTQL
jgi:glycine C-acetyltransferase